ncbi:MAG: hypothetical protein EPN91_03440 [Salinibacterium sp.]|nr:MAG: hypothetical protein EPN91_03440 [Salinibacterium sp.]
MAFDLISRKQTASNYALGDAPFITIGSVSSFDDRSSFVRKLPFAFALLGAFAVGMMLNQPTPVHPYTLKMVNGNSRNRKKYR